VHGASGAGGWRCGRRGAERRAPDASAYTDVRESA
jgi:hypothetical protein